MTSERVKAIEERLEKATPGPWLFYPFDGEPFTGVIANNPTPVVVCKNVVREADTDLICAAPSDLRFLLAERDRLAAEVEAARDSLAAIADEPGCCADIADAKAFAREALARLGERDRLAAELDRVTTERRNVLSELSKVAFKLGTTEAHLDAARVALEKIASWSKFADELNRSAHAMNGGELMAFRIGSAGAYLEAGSVAREALARLAKLKEAE